MFNDSIIHSNESESRWKQLNEEKKKQHMILENYKFISAFAVHLYCIIYRIISSQKLIALFSPICLPNPFNYGEK